MGTVFIILMATEPPIRWYEILGMIPGSVLIVYVLFRNRVSSPHYLPFNNKGLRGRLADKGRVRWSWDQIRRIEYRPVQLILCTTDGRTQIPLRHVDYRHRERVLEYLMETAREHNVEVEKEQTAG